MTTERQLALAHGFLAFLVLWSVVLIPQLITHWARFGRAQPRRLVSTAGVMLYGCLVLAVTMLPLPSGDGISSGPTMQLIPFQWINDVGREMGPAVSVSGALHTPAFQQAVLNVLLFVPLGVIGYLLRRQRFATTVLMGLTASFAIELAQLTANFGTAPYPYRIADVDDVINNTAGAALGWIACAVCVMLHARTGKRGVAGSRSATVAGPARQHLCDTRAPSGHRTLSQSVHSNEIQHVHRS